MLGSAARRRLHPPLAPLQERRPARSAFATRCGKSSSGPAHVPATAFIFGFIHEVIRGLERPTNPAVECAARLRRHRPDVFLGVGGPDVFLDPGAYRPSFDLVFQGEVGSVDLLDVVRSGVPFFQAPPADINAEPLDYRPLSGKKYLAGSLQTARGCPHDCSFCNVAHFSGRAVRRLAPRLLEERLESLADIHRGFVIIGDSNFAGGSAAAMKEYLDVLYRVQERRGFLPCRPPGVPANIPPSRYPPDDAGGPGDRRLYRGGKPVGGRWRPPAKA